MMPREATGQLLEIYSSLQGEGPHVGKAMTFVRLQGCHIRCRWCDTPHSFSKRAPFCRIEKTPGSKLFERYDNPVFASQLNLWLEKFKDPVISITGGEPLEQAEFLKQWLSTVKNRKVLLETAGIHTEGLKKVLPYLDIISMDFKLPSSTGLRAFWKEHRSFLKTALKADKEIYVKIVLSENMAAEELEQAAALIQEVAPHIPVICQPVTPTPEFPEKLTGKTLLKAEAILKTVLPNIQTLPQMHKLWDLL